MSGFRLTSLCLSRPRVTLLVGLLVAVLFASGLPRLELRTDGRAIYPSGNRVVQQSEADAERFREPDQLILLVSARPGGPPVASAAGLLYLKEIDRHLRALPVVDADKVRSLASLLEPEPGLSALQHVREYLEEVPATPAEVAALRERVRRHPLGEGLFLSSDGSTAAVYAPFAKGVSRREAVDALEDWSRLRTGSAFDLRLTGPVVAEVLLGRKVLRDLARIIPVMILVMALLLYGCLGTPGALAAVMAEVIVVLVCVLGGMGYAGVPVTLVTTVLPVAVMVLAVADEVHFLERLQAFQAETADTSRAGRHAGAEAALREMGRPMVLTSLTTAAGFLAFPASDIVPLRDFGIFAAGGILLAMLSSFTLIPALVVSLPASWWRSARRRSSVRAGSSLSPFYAWVWRHESAAFALGLGLLAALLPGSLFLSVQDSWIDNFDRASPIATADRLFNAKLWGTYRFDIVLESREPRFFRRAEGVGLVQEVSRVASAAPHAAGVVSHVTSLRVLAGLTGRPEDVSRLPPEDLRTLMALSTLLRSSLDLDHFLSRDARAARVRILVKDADYRRGMELREHLRRHLGPLLRGRGVRFHWSGDLPIALEVVRTILTNQLGSIAWSLVGIAAVLLLVLRRPADVVVLLAPVLAAAGLVFGAIGYLGLPLGIASSMFLALSIGSGTDFSLHFFHAHREARAEGAEHAEAVGRSLATAGRAVRWNALVLGLGFLVLTLSSLPPNRFLGLLLAAAMLAGYLMTVLLLPRLLRMRASGGGPHQY
ncbi:MAG TPA: MMPL family transporter [Thermoanaerobaculia bacterium]